MTHASRATGTLQAVVLTLIFAGVAPAGAAETPATATSWLVPDAPEPAAAIAPPSATTAVADVAQSPIVFDRTSVLAQGGATAGATTDAVQLKPSGELWGGNKSYVIPALEIVGFDTLLNLFDRAYFGCCDFDVTGSSIKRNLRRGFATDRDGFTVNQLGHPYQGSMYHGFARASGLTFWEGFVYTLGGSLMWEIAGETTRPSTNDMVNTTLGGAFLGESLFRMSNLLLEQWGGPRQWRELGAAAISPPVGFNRLAFGKRFDAVYPSNNAEYYSRIAFGASYATQNNPGTSRDIKRTEGIIDFGLDYGLPGNPGYVYRRPFDYFAFQASGSTAVGFESVMTRGLLLGTDYGRKSKHYKGIWGLYGSYDYMAPQIFRLASSAASIGTTFEWRPSDAIGVQGSALAGVGYATVSTIRGLANERDNRYGFAPQALVALRLIFGDRTALDLTAREYFVSDVASDRGGHDNVVRTDATLTWRIHRHHAVAVKYQYSRRNAESPDFGDRRQSRGTLGIYYTILGRDRFGMGDWR